MQIQAIVVPLVILVAGCVTYAVLPLPSSIRLPLLLGDLVAAGIVGWVLWRRQW